jgi:hypothetical protein
MQIQIQLELNRVVLTYSYDPITGAIGATAAESNPQKFILDLFPDEKIPVSYAVSDPADASVRPTPFTKSFLIPATQTNSKAFNFPYMASSERAWYIGRAEIIGNTYVVYASYGSITVDGIPIFVGTVDLTSVNIVQGEVASYEINFLATEINLFNTYLNNRLLTQQPFTIGATSGGVFGIDISNPSEVVVAMGVTGPDTTFTLGAGSYGGFLFAYPDFGWPDDGFAGAPGVCIGQTGPSFNTTEDVRSLYATGPAPTDIRKTPLRAGYNLLPYPFVKTYIDQAFDSTPFTYVSDFFQTDEFKSLVLLYLDNTKVPTNSFMYRFGYNPEEFYADRSISNPVVVRTIDSLDECAVPGTFPVDANQRCEDIYSFWDPVEGAFVLPADGTYEIQIQAKAIVRFGWDQLVGGIYGANCPGGTPNANLYPHTTYPLIGPNSVLEITNESGSVVDFVSIANPTKVGADVLAVPNTYTKNGGTHYQWEAVYNLWSTPTTFSFTGNAGDKFYIKFAYDAQNYYAAPVAGGCNAFPVNERLYEDAMDLIVEDVRDSTINWPRTIPPITEKEFFQQIVKLFNLYFEITPNSNQLKIEPRNEFYDDTNVLDWTNKLDISQSRTIQQFLPPKQVFFKYQDTQNFADTEIQKIDNLYNLNAGSTQVQYINGQGEQSVELLAGSTTPYLTYSRSFGTTPWYPQFPRSGSYYNIPGLALYPKQDDGLRELAENSNYFFAFVNGLVASPVMWNNSTTRTPVSVSVSSLDGVSTLKIGGTGATAAQILTTFSTLFPGATSATPATDLGFKPTSTYIWRYGTLLGSEPGLQPSAVVNSETLYTKYYEGFYQNLNRQRFLKAKFKLTTADIANFSFRNPVFVRFPNGDAAQYIVQSINYDPTTNSPAEVMLSTYNPLYIN